MTGLTAQPEILAAAPTALQTPAAWIVLAIFAVVFVALAIDKIDKSIVALAGALALVLAQVQSFHASVLAVDFETVGLLLGMMLLVACMRELGIFDWLAGKIAIATGGHPQKILIGFGLGCAGLSAFLDSVTTVLVLVPLAIQLARSLAIDARPTIFTLILLSNIGGTLTMVGNPPNIILGTQVPEEMPFFAFPQYTFVPIAISTVAVLYLLCGMFRVELAATGNDREAVIAAERRRMIDTPLPARIGGPVIGICVAIAAGLILNHPLHERGITVGPAAVALSGAIVMLLYFRRDADYHRVLQRVEWSTLLFFAGLLAIVGAAEHVGLLGALAAWLAGLTQSTWVMILLVLWMSAIVSAVVDNIPFIAVMVPVLKTLLSQPPFSDDPNHHLVWWALCLGGCLGGNATQVGASSNVVSCALARKEGQPISFGFYFRVAALPTLVTIIICTAYLAVLYFVF